MSTYNLIKKLYKEIDDINTEIDNRIERGLPYKALSRRHQALISQLRSIDRPSILSIGFSKLAKYASVFLM